MAKADDDGFLRKPHKLTEDQWFYEGKQGLTIAVTGRGTLQSIVSIVEIPWRRLLPSVDRYQKFKRRAKRRRTSQ